MDWLTLFMPTTPPLESVVRGTLAFLALLLLLRLTGQRESGALGLTDVLLVVLVAGAAGPGLYGHASSLGDSLILVATILLWSVALDALAYRFPGLAPLLKAHPRPLIHDGELNHRALRREFITRDEVESQLRLHGIDDISEVGAAYLEPNGMISIIRRDHGDVEPVPPSEPL